MKRKRVCLIMVAGLVFIGMLGIYPAWGSSKLGLTSLGSYKWGLTYRMGSEGGIKIKTDSGLGGEVLFNYRYTKKDGEHKYRRIEFYPSITYYLVRDSSNTLPYLGLGFYYSRKGGFGDDIDRTSGLNLLAGIEHFFNKNFSCDLRVTVSTISEQSTDNEQKESTQSLHFDLGFSLFL